MLDDVKKKIRKLLNVAADDSASQGEIDNALRFAQRLMAEHHIAEEELTQAERAERRAMGTKAVYSDSSKRHTWESSLSTFVAKFVGCGSYTGDAEQRRTPAGILVNGDPARYVPRIFYGEEDLVLLAAELYYDLRQGIIALARMKFGGAYRGSGRSYCEGFVAGLYQQMEAATAADVQTKALAVRSQAIIRRKRAEAKDWLSKERGIELSPLRKGQGRQDLSAYCRGREDGSRYEIGSRRTPGRLAENTRKSLPG